MGAEQLAEVAAHALRFWTEPLVMLGVVTYDGFFLLTSPTFTDVLGWSQEELQSVPYWELLHPDDQHPLVEDGDRLMRSGGGRLSSDVRVLCRNGRFKWTRWSAVADQDQHLLYGSGTDVTDLKPALADRPVAVGTWVRHVPTSTLKWSDELYAMFGFALDEPLDDEQILKRVHRDDRPGLLVDATEALACGDVVADTVRVNRPDGSTRVLRSSGRVVRSDSAASQSVRGITIDVTGRGIS